MNAYLHVPIHPSSRKFLRFLYKNKVFQFPFSTLRLVIEPESLHSCGRCHDAPCLISGVRDSPPSGRLTLEKPAGGPLQGSNSGPSSLNCSPGLSTQPGEVRASSNSILHLHWHALSKRFAADVPSGGPFQRDSQSCSSGPPGKVCYSSGLSLAFGETGVNIRSSAT